LEIIKPETHIGFVSKMRNALLVSIVLILIAIVSLIYHKGPNWGVEFMGGTELHIKLSQGIKPGEIMAMLRDVGYAADSVQSIGLSGDNEYLIQFSPETVDFEGIQKFQNRLEEMFSEFPEFKGASILRLDFIGPKVGKELIEKAVLSILLACVGILIYLIFRFEFAFAMGAVIALIHDTIITMGAVSVTDKEFTLAIVAGLLTVIGYSVNDTIVIFDRIRENLKKAKGKGFKNTINERLNLQISKFTRQFAK